MIAYNSAPSRYACPRARILSAKGHRTKWRWGSERGVGSPVAHRERMRGRSLCVGGLEDAESKARHLRSIAQPDGRRERERRGDGMFGCEGVISELLLYARCEGSRTTHVYSVSRWC